MPRVIASFAVVAGLCLMPHVSAQEAVKAKEDSCTIPMSLFIPIFQKSIVSQTMRDSEVRKAAVKVLSQDLLQKGSFKFTGRGGKVISGVSEKLKIEPASGEVESDGKTWKWEITANLGDVEIFGKASPVYARFKFLPRLTISHPAYGPVQALGVWTEDRWFYIVAGGGSEQDGTKVPKNALPRDK